MILRLLFLLGISILMRMQASWINLDNYIIQVEISGQAIVLFLGGFFLLYKSPKEIF